MNLRSNITALIFILMSITCLNVSALNNTPIENKIETKGYDITPYQIIQWDGDGNESLAQAKADSTGNVIITCASNSFGVTGLKVFILKYNFNLSLLWNVTWDSEENATPCDLVLDSNDNIYVAGTTFTEFSLNNYTSNVFLIKYFANGTKDWDYVYATHDKHYYPSSITIGKTGNIYMIGTHSDTSVGKIFIQNCYSNGTMDWIKYYGLIDEALTVGKMVLDENDNIFITGSSDNSIPSSNKNDVVIIKLDNKGDALWNKTYGGSSILEKGNDLVLLDKGIFLVGTYGSGLANPTDAYTTKLNETGGHIWNATKDFGEKDEGKAITVNHYQKIVIIGTNELTINNYNIFIAEYDRVGNFFWNTTWESGGNDIAQDIVASQHYLYAIVQSFNNTSNNYDLNIIHYRDPNPPSTSYFSPGIAGIVVGYLIAIIGVGGSLVYITFLVFTYFKKKENKTN